MAIYGTKPLEGENVRHSFEILMVLVLNSVRNRAVLLDRAKSLDDGFMADIVALRALAEALGKSTLLVKSEIEELETKAISRLERLRRKLPKDCDFDVYCDKTRSEFRRLLECAYNRSPMHARSKANDLKQGNLIKKALTLVASDSQGDVGETETSSATEMPLSSSVEKPRCFWDPCTVIAYPKEHGDPRFGLLLEPFDPNGMFAKHDITITGYTWHALIDVFLESKPYSLRESLEFDPESSLFCVRSSDLNALYVVADFIQSTAIDGVLTAELFGQLKPELL